jgi:pimeloyl-ACP methyl ester carboxylesterase
MPLAVDRRGSGPVVLFLPSFSLDTLAMAAVVEPVFAPDPGWTRLYVDLPGTGASPPGEPRSDAVLDALVHMLEATVGSRRLTVAGWSYGGFLAAGLARRLPRQVAGLLMVCSGLRIRPQHRDLTGVLPSLPEPGWLDPVPPLLHDHFRAAVGVQTADVARRLAGVLALNAPGNDDYLATLRRDGFFLSDEEAVTTLDGPVSLLAGRRDRVAGYRGLRDAVDAFPHAEYVLAAEAGHYLPVEEPDLFRGTVLRWLDRCRPLVGE